MNEWQHCASACFLQEDFPMSWLKVTSSASSPSMFPASLFKVKAAALTTRRFTVPFLLQTCQVRRDREHQPGAWQEDGEVQRLLLHLLRGPEEHHPGCGQLQRHQGDAAVPVTLELRLCVACKQNSIVNVMYSRQVIIIMTCNRDPFLRHFYLFTLIKTRLV